MQYRNSYITWFSNIFHGIRWFFYQMSSLWSMYCTHLYVLHFACKYIQLASFIKMFVSLSLYIYIIYINITVCDWPWDTWDPVTCTYYEWNEQAEALPSCVSEDEICFFLLVPCTIHSMVPSSSGQKSKLMQPVCGRKPWLKHPKAWLCARNQLGRICAQTLTTSFTETANGLSWALRSS